MEWCVGNSSGDKASQKSDLGNERYHTNSPASWIHASLSLSAFAAATFVFLSIFRIFRAQDWGVAVGVDISRMWGTTSNVLGTAAMLDSSHGISRNAEHTWHKPNESQLCSVSYSASELVPRKEKYVTAYHDASQEEDKHTPCDGRAKMLFSCVTASTHDSSKASTERVSRPRGWQKSISFPTVKHVLDRLSSNPLGI